MKKTIRQRKYRIKCHICDTEFEYQSEDIKYTGCFHYVNCPSCGQSLRHNPEEANYSTTKYRVDTMKL